MRYTVRKSVVWLVGHIWQPGIGPCSQMLSLRAYDVENIRAYGEGSIDRDAVEHWLMLNSGDFRDVIDFSASIEDGNRTIDIPWATEDGEMAYSDCTTTED